MAGPETRAVHAGPVHGSLVQLTLACLTAHIQTHCLSSGHILPLNRVSLAGFDNLGSGCPCEGIILLRNSSVRSPGHLCLSPGQRAGSLHSDMGILFYAVSAFTE